MSEKRTVAPWLAVAFLAGVIVSGWVIPSRIAPTPWNPVPSPHDERPILAGVVRLAKTLGWFLVFAEPAPPEATPEARVVEHQEPEEPAEVGSDGYAVLRNARGW